MRWFKHMTDAHDDPFLNWVIRKWGMRGYGWYWALIELVAGNGKPGTDSDGYDTWFLGCCWADVQQVLRTKRATAQQFLSSCSAYAQQLPSSCGATAKVTYEQSGEFLRIDCPKILEIKDEYTRRSGQRRDSVGTVSGIKGKGDLEGDIKGEGEPEVYKGEPHSVLDDIPRLTPEAARAMITQFKREGVEPEPEVMKALKNKANGT